MNKKKVLITGCLGHIGSYLIHNSNFLTRYDVFGVDDFTTQRYCSLFHKSPYFSFQEKSFIDLSQEEIGQFDAIIHLAAIADAASSFSNIGKIEKINVEETKKFFEKVARVSGKENKKINIVFPSTTSVYGTNKEIVDETSELNPQSPYAESKIEVENFIQQLYKEYKQSFSYMILRLGTIFGISPGIRFHTAVNKFVFNAALGIPLSVWRQNYTLRRPYLGIKDALQALEIAIKYPCNDVFNVLTTNMETERVVNAVQVACVHLGINNLELKMVDTPLLNQFDYIVNGVKFAKILGFKPNDNLSVEVEKTLKLFLEKRGI